MGRAVGAGEWARHISMVSRSSTNRAILMAIFRGGKSKRPCRRCQPTSVVFEGPWIGLSALSMVPVFSWGWHPRLVWGAPLALRPSSQLRRTRGAALAPVAGWGGGTSPGCRGGWHVDRGCHCVKPPATGFQPAGLSGGFTAKNAESV